MREHRAHFLAGCKRGLARAPLSRSGRSPSRRFLTSERSADASRAVTRRRPSPPPYCRATPARLRAARRRQQLAPSFCKDVIWNTKLESSSDGCLRVGAGASPRCPSAGESTWHLCVIILLYTLLRRVDPSHGRPPLSFTLRCSSQPRCRSRLHTSPYLVPLRGSVLQEAAANLVRCAGIPGLASLP